MQRTVAAAAIALALSSGCVTGAGIWKRDTGVSLPMFVGAVAADLVVTSVVASQVQDFTVGASLGTAAAVTAVDVAAGCLFGACSSLRL